LASIENRESRARRGENRSRGAGSKRGDSEQRQQRAIERGRHLVEPEDPLLEQSGVQLDERDARVVRVVVRPGVLRHAWNATTAEVGEVRVRDGIE